ncbi:hypothetical protein SAMN05216565_103294 [Litchfieldia salsa]|uniref:Uncharacterized protein n=1 Tax=Litchfieldia salsa TaxID=930152 RepID=A0A1H0T596_9BACI|nr:hypothetical protein SAMN05216565_103294 [Litchfieldia salsa]
MEPYGPGIVYELFYLLFVCYDSYHCNGDNQFIY